VPGRDEAPVTRLRPPAFGADRDERDVFPELTGEVSAIPGSPAAGAPVSASSSVSAQEREQQESAPAPWGEDLERTVVERRGHARWELVLPDGSTADLSGDVVILGRNPVADPAHPRAQLLAIADPTRTVSKTHARLERRGEVWRIVDLGSTNGTQVNGTKITEAPLPPDSVVTIGRTRITFRVVAQEASRNPPRPQDPATRLFDLGGQA
jgi:hypothetical protein